MQCQDQMKEIENKKQILKTINKNNREQTEKQKYLDRECKKYAKEVSTLQEAINKDQNK